MQLTLLGFGNLNSAQKPTKNVRLISLHPDNFLKKALIMNVWNIIYSTQLTTFPIAANRPTPSPSNIYLHLEVRLSEMVYLLPTPSRSSWTVIPLAAKR